MTFLDLSGKENSQFFQERVFIEFRVNSPCQLVVIQVPEIESRNPLEYIPRQFSVHRHQ